MLSRPNGELTRAGQYYYQLIGRPPPSRQYDRNQPLIREGPNDYIMLRGGAKKLLRSLQPNGNYQLTKLGRHFFKDKWVDWVVHVPVIIRGVRRNGRNRGMPYERTKRLPVTDLNVALSRQSEGLSDAQAARNLKASVSSRSSGIPSRTTSSWSCPTRPTTWTRRGSGPSASRPCRSWTTRWWWTRSWISPSGLCGTSPTSCFCGDEILESAFEQRPDKLCVARQLAELMRLPVQEVLSDFDAITGIGSKWREQGITPREIRSFCVWRQAPMFYVDCQGRLLDKYEPVVKEQRAVAFTSWNGHAFFYKSARTVAKCEPIGDRAQAKYRGERKWAGWGSPIAGSAWRARRARSSFTFSRRAGIRPGLGRPRSRTTSASSARHPSPRATCEPGPHRPRAPVLLRTGPEPPGPVPRVPPEQNGPWSSRTPRRWSPASAGGLTRPTWNRPGCPRWSSSSTATSRSGSATE